MQITPVYNLSLLNLIKKNTPISYRDLSRKYKAPEVPGVIQGCNVSFDNDLKVLESIGYIKKDKNSMIIYIKG